jgi:hypothetical protein
MSQALQTRSSLWFSHEGQLIQASYTFCSASEKSPGKNHVVAVDIEFSHPVSGERVRLRLFKSILLLCQSSTVIEELIKKEILEFIMVKQGFISSRFNQLAKAV